METQGQSKQFFLKFLMINLLTGAAAGILQLVVPLYALALKATVAQLGLVTGIGSIGRILIILPSGFLIDSYGTRKLYMYSTGLNIISILLLTQAGSPYSLILIMVFQGMTQAVSFMSLQASLLKQLPAWNANQSSWQRGSVLLGFHLLGPVLGGCLIENFRFFGTFLVISVILGLCIGFSLSRKQGVIPNSGSDILNLPRGQLVQLKEMLFDGFLLKLMLVEGFISLSLANFRTFVVPVAIEIFQLSIQTTSLLILFQGAATTVIVLGGGKLLNLFRSGWIFGGGCFLIISGTCLMAITESIGFFWATAVLFGCGTGLLVLYNFTRMTMAQGQTGKIAAMLSLSVAIGSIIGPVLGGLIGDTLALQAVFWTPALVLGLGGIILVVVKICKKY